MRRIELQVRYDRDVLRSRAGQALVLFVVPVVTGILLLIPGQSTTRTTSLRRHRPRISSSAHHLALIVCGASLIAGHFGGLYWLAGAHVGALLAGLLNAWVFLLVAGAHAQKSDRR